MNGTYDQVLLKSLIQNSISIFPRYTKVNNLFTGVFTEISIGSVFYIYLIYSCKRKSFTNKENLDLVWQELLGRSRSISWEKRCSGLKERQEWSPDSVQSSRVGFHLNFTFSRDEDCMLDAVPTTKFLTKSWCLLLCIAWLI